MIQYQASCDSECCELVVTSDDPDQPVKILDVVAYTRCEKRCKYKRGKADCGCDDDDDDDGDDDDPCE